MSWVCGRQDSTDGSILKITALFMLAKRQRKQTVTVTEKDCNRLKKKRKPNRLRDKKTARLKLSHHEEEYNKGTHTNMYKRRIGQSGHTCGRQLNRI